MIKRPSYQFLRFSLTLALLLFMIGWAKAQVYDSLCHHSLGHYDLEMRNMMELRDGGILANIQVFGFDDQEEYGSQLLKLRYQNGKLSLADSVFVEDNDLCFYLLERNPLGDDNVYAQIVRDFDSCRSYLQIAFFDDELVFEPEKEIHVPLEDTIVSWTGQHFMIDPYNDIILYYLDMRGDYSRCFLRVGLDGTVKQKVSYPLSEQPYTGIPYPMEVLDTNPLLYGFYGAHRDDVLHLLKFRCYTLDSLFQVQDMMEFETSTYWDPDGFDRIRAYDETTLLFMCRYRHELYYYGERSNGACVAKIDRRSHEVLKTTEFQTDPLHVSPNGQGIIGCAYPFGLECTDDGYVYFGYNTQDGTNWPEGWVSVVKMDSNLNVVWQRYFLEPKECQHMGKQLVLLQNGWVAVGVEEVETMASNVSFIVINDDGVGVSDEQAVVQPYLVHPNPVGDMLGIEFSPDVTPVSVEFYDLQGRRVLSQTGTFDRIPVAGLPAGTYLVRMLMDDGKVWSEKVVKR